MDFSKDPVTPILICLHDMSFQAAVQCLDCYISYSVTSSSSGKEGTGGEREACSYACSTR